ncbi:extracellular calcium-sensing receptor-like [Protopterus annectens]|uniref:extracellular calcium-sensing receptor-like n=1 Tax=Protopterus annectens TaxID=7888 RepID=UPI001CFA3E77|nr:extracellular calcium-sensing receptor-like [Protopterus annectens]
MIFAIDEINQNSNILPNITLGFKIFDPCYSASRALQGTIWMLGKVKSVPNYNCKFQERLSAIIGAFLSTSSLPVARLLGLYHHPQISHASSISLFSNKLMFPSFLRNVPNDNFQSTALAQLLIHFGWTWVGIVASDNDFGQLGSQNLKREITQTESCIEFLEVIPTQNSRPSILKIAAMLKKSTANAIILYTTIENLMPLMEEVFVHNISGKVWISITSWSVSSDISKKEFLQLFEGSIGFALHSGEIPGFKQFLYSIHPSLSPDDIFIKTFWEQAFGCKWQDNETSQTSKLSEEKKGIHCTGEEKLEDLAVSIYDVYNFRFTLSTYKSVYATAQALHDMFTCKPGSGPFYNRSCANYSDNIQPWQLLHYIRNVYFKTDAGEEVFFDKNGDPPTLYDILNWQLYPNGSGRYVKVGYFDNLAKGGKKIIINDTAILWSKSHNQVPRSVCSESCPPGYRNVVRQGQPNCCFYCSLCSKGEIANQSDMAFCIRCPDDQWSSDTRERCFPKTIEFLTYEESLGVTLTSAAFVCTFITACILCIFFRFRETPIVKANNRDLSFLLLVSLMLCTMFCLMFIGQPTKINCMLRQTSFGIIFSTSISCILAKTITVVIAFNATKPNSKLKKWVGSKLPNSIVASCCLIQVIMFAVWLTAFPPFPEQDLKSKDENIVIQCNEGSNIAFWCMLGYMGFLASISFVVAFLARKLPDTFNEAKFITFSMLVCISVWMSFVPAYLSTKGKYMVAVEIFAIISSTFGLLGCIFFPKCYIIITKPHMNTRDYLLGRRM